ncbi:tetratricopeptide repeat protein [Phragmitibacter flavus]|uniref:tetratricopeptide repeat protein n=1 Tax=Phragmitibacter flavus TaxID=2576071 RepID=UPI00140D6235|nr:tetratricopeptide repeat protein [Phragmitibacter flavus]
MPYDDPEMVLGNGYVNGGLTVEGIRWALTYHDSGLQVAHAGVENLWHPLTWISHMTDVQVFGVERAGGHHLTSVLLHCLTSWMVYLFAWRLTASPLAGLVAALLFAIHPLHVESVAWISDRKGVLSGLFFFSSLWMIVTGRRSWAWMFFLAAMMAKPSTVILPVLAILALGWKAGERSWGWRFWWTKLIEWRWWFGIALVISVMTLWFQGKGSHGEWMHHLSLSYRLLHLPGGLFFTLWHLFVPFGLTFHYAYPEDNLWVSLLFWVLLIFGMLMVWWWRRRYPDLFFAAMWFLVGALPSAGIFYVGTSYTADRYSYLPLTGAFLFFGLWVAGRGGKFYKGRVGFAGLLCCGLMVLSYRQCATWRDGWTLLTHAERIQPRNPVVLGNLGAMHQRSAQHREAMDLFRRALKIAPEDARVWYNMGNSLRDSGEPVEAIEAFRRAVNSSPGFANAWRNLGLVLCAPGNPQRDVRVARDAFARACELTSRNDAIPLVMLAEMEFELGNVPEARRVLEELQGFRQLDLKVQQAVSRLRTRYGD